MRRVLIFSASTGGGHNQVASVLQAELQANNYEVMISDFLKESNNLLHLIIASGYNNLAMRSASLYGLLYHRSNNKTVDKRLKSILSKCLRNTISAQITSFKPDLIITTHPMVVNVLGGLKAFARLQLPVISIVTDFAAHHMYFSKHIDAYITPYCIDTHNALLKGGIPENKIFPFGIPIKRDFYKQASNHSADKRFSVLLMAGSLGSKYLVRVINILLHNPYPLRIMVVCGKNYRLKTELKSRCDKLALNKEIIVYGYCNNISDLMDSAHLLISKPGGITSSEAIAKKLPLLIPYAIPGQEEENARILVDNGLALRVRSFKEINDTVTGFIENPDSLQKIARHMEAFNTGNALDRILELSDQLIDYHAPKTNLPYLIQK